LPQMQGVRKRGRTIRTSSFRQRSRCGEIGNPKGFSIWQIIPLHAFYGTTDGWAIGMVNSVPTQGYSNTILFCQIKNDQFRLNKGIRHPRERLIFLIQMLWWLHVTQNQYRHSRNHSFPYHPWQMGAKTDAGRFRSPITAERKHGLIYRYVMSISNFYTPRVCNVFQ